MWTSISRQDRRRIEWALIILKRKTNKYVDLKQEAMTLHKSIFEEEDFISRITSKVKYNDIPKRGNAHGSLI